MPLDSTTAITIGSVSCWDEETKEHFGRNGSHAERTILVPWTNRIALAAYLLGGNTTSGTNTVYGTPQQYPDATFLYASDVDIKGEGLRGTAGSGGMVSYDRARLTVAYKPLEFSGQDEVGAEELDFGCDSQVISHSNPVFKWGDNNNGLAVHGQPIVRTGVVHFSKSLKSVPVLPVSTIISLLDNVNSSTYMGAPAKQMLFRGARSQRRFTATGASNWDVTFHFTFRSRPWDQHYRPGSNPAEGPAGWATVLYTDGSPLYTPGNLALLGIS